MRSHRILLAFLPTVLVACVPSDPTEEDAVVAESGITTAARLDDLRTQTRFFRRYGAEPSRPFAVNGTTLFFAKQGRTVSGERPEAGLYRTNGTTATRVAKIDGDPWGTPATYADRLYGIVSRTLPGPGFRSAYELSRTDGTAAGTAPVAAFAQLGVRVRAIAASGSALFVATIEDGANGKLARLSKLTREPTGSDAVTPLFETPVSDEWASLGIAVADSGPLLFAAGGTVVRSDGTAAGSIVVARDRKIQSVVATAMRLFFLEPSTTVAGASELFEAIDRPAANPGPRTRGYGPITIPNATASYVTSSAALGDGLVLVTKGGLFTVDATTGTVSGHAHDFDKGVSMAVMGTKLFALDARGVLVETDGTVAGTQENTIAATPAWSTEKPAADLVVFDGALHFIQWNARTQQVVRVEPGNKSVISTFPAGAQLERLRVVGGKLYVAAGGYGKELHVHSGAGFTMLEANAFGNASSDPRPIAATTQHLLFTVNEDVDWFATSDGTQQSLMVTDGTPGGTKKLRSGYYSFYSGRMRTPAAVTVGTRACVVEQVGFKRAIVCTDGTAAGTSESPYAFEQAPVVLGDSVYFVRWGAGGNGQDVVRFDGASGTTVVLASLPKGSTVRDLVARDADVVFFVEAADVAARGIWTSDGTAAGTIRMVPNPRFLGADERVVGRVGNDLFVSGPADGGGAIYKTDGTATGTVMLAAIPFDRPDTFFRGAALGNKVVFPVKGYPRAALWVTDGSAAGTFALADNAEDTFYNLHATADGRAAFSTGRAVVITDGTDGGTARRVMNGNVPVSVAGLPGKGFVVSSYDDKNLYLVDATGVAPLETGRGTFMNFAPIPLANGLVFSGPLDGKGIELLYTDGTPNGTRIVADVAPGAASSKPEALFVGRGRVWFAAEDAQADRELYSLPIAGLP